MYESYYGLTERPFSIAPDPQYLYMSSRHKEAMAHLSYGLSQGGCFIVLTGEVGTGKTTLCRNLMGELPDNVDVALILNANIDERELLQTICDELKIPYTLDITQKHLLDRINEYLLNTFAQNRHTVLIIDEAQLLSRDVLEQIRLLTNLETTKAKLLQIILIGQPELNDLLSRNDLRQLAQRVTARYHLGALRRTEIEEYVNYRLGVAGCKQPLFSKQALTRMHALTDGIPRKINVLADHALLAAYAKNQRLVDAKTVKSAAHDVFFDSAPAATPDRKKARYAKWSVAATAVVLANIALWWWFWPTPAPLTAQQPTLQDSAVMVDPGTAPAVAAVATAVTDDSQTEQALNIVVVEEGSAQSSELPDNAAAERAQPLAAPNAAPATNNRAAGTVIVAEEFLDASTDLPAGVEQVLQGEDVGLSDQTEGGQSAELAAAGMAGPSSNPVEDSSSALSALPVDSALGPLLETSADLTGRIAAFRNLAAIWQVSLPEQLLPPACVAVSQQGLRCLGFSNWLQLRRFNRPAIIVVGHRDQLHRVIVQSIEGDQARIMIGADTYDVSVNELRSRWTGSGVLFWRASEAGSDLRQLGQQGNAILAVRNYLNRALARARMPLLESTDLAEFDLDMSQKVFALQTRFGIVGDSKIGHETYLLMNELVEPAATPVLRNRL